MHSNEYKHAWCRFSILWNKLWILRLLRNENTFAWWNEWLLGMRYHEDRYRIARCDLYKRVLVITPESLFLFSPRLLRDMYQPMGITQIEELFMSICQLLCSNRGDQRFWARNDVSPGFWFYPIKSNRPNLYYDYIYAYGEFPRFLQRNVYPL